jgi:hypothetical protein
MRRPTIYASDRDWWASLQEESKNKLQEKIEMKFIQYLASLAVVAPGGPVFFFP